MKGLMRGHLKSIILNALENKPMSGSELMSKIEGDIGWKPSCGSIYPVLNSIVTENLAKVDEDKKQKKIYSLTKKGKEELKKHNEDKKELVEEIINVHKAIEAIYGVDLNIDEKTMNNIKEGKLFFGPFHKEVEELKREFMLIMSKGLNVQNSKELKKILKDTTVKVREIRFKNKKPDKKPIIKRSLAERKKNDF